MQRITANGIDFAYLEAGEGPLVLCLHGFPDHAPTFEPLLAALADAGYHAVAPWMRGYSPTGPSPDGQYHTQHLALDAIALADALAGDGDAYLIGSDWGAGAAALAVGHKPDRFKKLVTMAVPPQNAMNFLGSVAQYKRSWYVWFFGTPLADFAVPANDFELIDVLWADWSPNFTPPDGFLRALKDTFAADNAQAAIGYYRDSFHGRTQATGEGAKVGAGAITIPHLYFHGRNDGCLGVDLVDEKLLADAVTDYMFVDNAGHFMHLEQPDQVNAKILEFLKA